MKPKVINEEEGVIEVEGEIRVPSHKVGLYEFRVFEAMRMTKKELDERIEEAKGEFAKDGYDVANIEAKRIRVEDRPNKVHWVQIIFRKSLMPGGGIWIYEN